MRIFIDETIPWSGSSFVLTIQNDFCTTCSQTSHWSQNLWPVWKLYSSTYAVLETERSVLSGLYAESPNPFKTEKNKKWYWNHIRRSKIPGKQNGTGLKDVWLVINSDGGRCYWEDRIEITLLLIGANANADISPESIKEHWSQAEANLAAASRMKSMRNEQKSVG